MASMHDAVMYFQQKTTRAKLHILCGRLYGIQPVIPVQFKPNMLIYVPYKTKKTEVGGAYRICGEVDLEEAVRGFVEIAHDAGRKRKFDDDATKLVAVTLATVPA